MCHMINKYTVILPYGISFIHMCIIRKCIGYIYAFPCVSILCIYRVEYTIATVCLQKFTCAMALKNDAFHLMIPPQFQGHTLSGLTSFIMYRADICKLSSRPHTPDHIPFKDLGTSRRSRTRKSVWTELLNLEKIMVSSSSFGMDMFKFPRWFIYTFGFKPQKGFPAFCNPFAFFLVHNLQILHVFTLHLA